MRRRSLNKFGAVKTTVDAITFDSKKEARRYQDLKLLERAGVISELCVDKKQLRYSLVVNSEKICTYVADFRYVENGRTVIEDTKGFKTPEYKLKAKLMKACHGIEIREI